MGLEINGLAPLHRIIKPAINFDVIDLKTKIKIVFLVLVSF